MNKGNWEYCPTHANPADLASRGCPASKLVNNELWFCSPAFLLEPPENWPRFFEPLPNVFLLLPQDETIEQNVLAVSARSMKLNLAVLIDCKRYSSYDKLLRITAIVLKFIKSLRGVISCSRDDIIDSVDLDRAKILWRKFSETKRHLKVIKDEQGVYRVSGRLDNAPIPFSTKFPVLLPRNHHFTELVIRKNHLIVEHNSTN